MQAVIQRVFEARVTVGGEIVGQIGPGLLALVSVTADDDGRDINWMVAKMLSLRIFRDGEKHFERDVRETGGGVLLVSNFTVSAETRKGRRPSFDQAAPPATAEAMFAQFVEAVKRESVPVATGRFGADMKVTLTNDGPATFILDSSGTVQPRKAAT